MIDFSKLLKRNLPVDIHIDLETRSKIDLKKVGAHRYAEDPTTEILMAAISEGDGPTFLWVNPKFECGTMVTQPQALTLLQKLSNPNAEVFAHNAEFERSLLNARMLVDMGFVPPLITQYRCTAAMARRAAMPAKLSTLCGALSLAQRKDKGGRKWIAKFSVPRKTTGEFSDPKDFAEGFREFGDYCVQDVNTEKEVAKCLVKFRLSGFSLSTFQLDSTLNDRGLPVNVSALRNANRILKSVWNELEAEFLSLTNLMPTQKEKVKVLLRELGVDIENMKGETLKAAIERTEAQIADVAPMEDEQLKSLEHQLKILKCYDALNYAAAKKVPSMLACVCADGRVRGTLLYHGAGTGRWSGLRIQPQNFKRPAKHLAKDTATIYQMICDGISREDLELIYGNALEVIASCIRHFIQCGIDADYAAIEARIVCWLAGQEDMLETFRKADAWTGPKELKPDVYKDMAAEIFSKLASEVEDFERTVGKHTVLGCGFGMWWPKFVETCAKFGVTISDELAEKAVRAYRSMADKVAELWELTETAAKSAIANPGKIFRAGAFLKFCVTVTGGIPYLVMQLPSGRNIVYPHPRIEWTTYIGKDYDTGTMIEKRRRSITFFGQIPGKQIWGRIKTYGASLLENATQGVAADVMSNGATKAEEAGFEVLTLIHDQALAWAHPGHTPELFRKALIDLPAWAAGLPINAEAKFVPFYTKL